MVLRNRQAHLVLLCSLLGSSAAQLRAVPFTRADTNADGTVNITDPINTLGFLFLGDPQSILCRDAADSNDDGQVNISDAINTLAFLFVGGTSIPEPGTTTCGLDPTLDALSCGVFPPCGPLLPPSVHDITPSSPTNVDMVTLSGATIPRAEVRVVGGAAVASVAADAEGRFSLTVLLEKNRLNRLFITASCPPRGASAPTAVEITQDAQPPSLFIDGPEKPQTEDTIQTFYKTITVYGRVADILSGFMGLQVTVAGEPAYVAEGIGTNGTFERRDVPLVIGDNEINVSARDQAGNVTTKAIFVRRTEVPAGPILIPAPHPLESGNNQGGMVGAELLKPIRVQVVRNGVPFAGKIVTFHVTRSDGRLSAVQGTLKEEGSLMLQVRSDADGMAQAYWTLGTDAGCGNNRVTATSTSVAGSVVFCASGTAAPPDRILIGSGNNQRVETGAPAPEALRAWVSDGCNGAREQSVTFTVVRGDGIVNGGTSATVLTTRTGHAQVSFTLGTQPGNNIVEATFPGNPGLPATFVIYGLERVENAPTVFSGIVLDNGGQPIEGVNCTLEFRATAATVGDTTDVNGLFRFDNLPDAGPAYVFVNGLAATHVGGSPGTDVPRGSFPFLLYDVVIVPNALNSLPAPIKLPKLDPDNERLYDGTRDVKLEVKGVQGLSMIVRTGTVVTVPGGMIIDGINGKSTTLSLNQVHHDDVPMPMPDGAAPPFAWTLQPAGATFNPPAEITYPNMSGLPAGALAYFLSFNHDAGAFAIVATGRVNIDGSEILSDTDSGISIAGWGCSCPPYAITGDCCNDCCEEGEVIDPCCDFEDPCCDNYDPCDSECGDPCAPECPERACNPSCGGHPCNVDCPRSACEPECGGDPCAFDCPDFPCNSECGGDPCSPSCGGPCDDDCPESTCDPQCGGDPCSLECNPDPCDPRCGGDPCSAECGGPCSEKCPTSPCDPNCGADPCSEECGGPCSAHCPFSECNPDCGADPCTVECGGDPICDPICGGSPCSPACLNAPCDRRCGGNPCAEDCPTAPCDPICGANPCSPRCRNPCDPRCGGNPCDPECNPDPCNPQCGGNPCSPECRPDPCDPACGSDPCAPECDPDPCDPRCGGDPLCDPECGGDPCGAPCNPDPCNPRCGGDPCAPTCDPKGCDDPNATRTFRISVTTFIPFNYFCPPVFCDRVPSLLWPLLDCNRGLVLIGRGDGIDREFDPRHASFRTRQVITVKTPRNRDDNAIVSTPLSKVTNSDIHVASSELLSALLCLTGGVERFIDPTPYKSLPNVTTGILDPQVTWLSPTRIRVDLRGSAVTSFIRFTLPEGLADINWCYSILISNPEGNGAPRYAIWGGNDNWPAYEVYINDEIIHGFRPTVPSATYLYGDCNEVVVAGRGRVPSLVSRLSEDWTVTIGGQSAKAEPNGTFLVSNIPAVDSRPFDSLGDQFIRAVAINGHATPTLYAFSDVFQVRGSGRVALSRMTVTEVPPRAPEAIVLTTSRPLLTRDQASAQVTTLAIFRDGSQQDVTRREDWTTYRVSNPSLVNVTDHGAVNAIGNGSGQAFITATNEGATATIQVTVVADDPLTTVEGVAWTPEGSPVMGARVYVSSADGQRQIVTAADGRFSVDQVPTTLGAISVTVRATVDGLPVVGKSGALVVAPGGITDAGIITLRQGRLDNLIPIFDRSAATPALLAVAEDGTILNRYPVDFHAWAVAKNLSGDYWATDADELIQFSMDETEYIELGRYEFEGSDLSEIAIAPTGDLWICDNRRRTVSRFTPSGTFIEDVAVTYESTYGVAIAPHSEVAEGYYVWYTSYTNDSALAEVVRLNPSTGNRVRIPHTNARIWGLAVDHLGRIWVPLEVGGSPSRDRLVGYTADGTEFSSIVVNVTGTFMIDGVVTPDGHIWCAAADGHGSGFINPAYLFEFDENGSLLKEIDLGPDNLAPRGIFADGAGQVWTSLTAGRAMHVEPRNGEAAFRVTVEHPVNRGDPAGYLQAFIIHPDLDFDGDGAPNRQELQGGRNPFVSGE